MRSASRDLEMEVPALGVFTPDAVIRLLNYANVAVIATFTGHCDVVLRSMTVEAADGRLLVAADWCWGPGAGQPVAEGRSIYQNLFEHQRSAVPGVRTDRFRVT